MTGRLLDRRVVVGVGGGIAAFRAVDLVRALQREGASVRVAMTPAATQFVGPLTFEALTRHPVLTDVLALAKDGSIEHVEWGHWAELLVIAPATADLLARMAAGQAGDAVTILNVCSGGARVLCPAMEPLMWSNPLTQRNLATLASLPGTNVVPPEEGALASGRTGMGRLAAVETVLDAVVGALSPRDFHGVRVLVTAGPTQEPLDPVRFLSNRSTGKMGVALARAALQRGAQVTLIHGPLQVPVPTGMETHAVTTALSMLEALRTQLISADVLIMAAAVSDYRPAHVASHKLKKGAAEEPLALVANPDLLMTTQAINPRCFRVGFAAETQQVESHAAEKLARKGLQLMVANDVSAADAGFGADTNRVILMDGKSTQPLPLMDKTRVAHAILDRVASMRSRAQPG
jgi:phosphopantothenoylcysteine decarboxylase/phosphopantothenate--cysteine ligase